MDRAVASDAPVALALDRAAARLCAPLALTLAGLLVGIAAFQLAFGRDLAPRLLPVWGAAALALTGIGALAFRRPPAQGHATLALVLAIPLLLAVDHLSVARQPIFTTMLLLVVLAHAVLGLHAGWHLAIAAPAVAGWTTIVATDAYPGDWVPMGILLAASIAVGGIAQIMRVKDRSELERARISALDQEARMAALTDAALEGIALHERGTILLANPALARMVGHDAPAALAGHHALELVAPASRAVVEAHLALPDGAPYEVLLERRDGTTFHAEVASRGFVYQGRAVQVTAVRDVSPRRAAAEASAERDRLRALGEMRRRFINDAAHQLHTPLTPIKLAVHMLANGRLGPLAPRQADAVATIQRNTEQLAVLARMLLDTAELAEDGAIDPAAHADASQELRDALHTHEERARSLGVRIDAPQLPAILVRADPARLSRAMRGLVGELLDAASPGTRLEIDARVGDGRATLWLARDGPGEARGATDAHEHLYVDLARRLIAPHGGTLETRLAGPRREYVLGLPLADAPLSTVARPF